MNKKTPIENISLSFACDKDWGAMRPCSSGRYCSACDKTVIDFTSKGMNELHQALEKEGQVCGCFLPSQLSDTISPKFFNFNRVAASLLLALGFSAFSRDLQAQAVDNTNSNRSHDKAQSEQLFGIIQATHPVYKHGGEQGMLDFIQKNLQYPFEESINGLVVTSFVIDTTGTVTEPNIVKGLSEEADKEALRVVKLLEFYPSIQDGKKVPVRFTLPVRFYDDRRKKK
ncbi:energy transducer TonB [Pontibacter sp. KCTC 32443]|uniref:energy transducer TonB n=1 Tax=Pontibacter TaxID=323449 RepID=UPI00164E4BAE|nr:MULTISPECIES: energy transducer TonB [Pontibacter]MBC5775991.1 energy transducer TonB [Pontibacter sp. KCTC 32443]